MSDTIETLRTRKRELETAHVTLLARIDEIDQLIAILEHAPRRGRPRVVTSDDPPEAA